jgi:hypothetical protein
MTTKTKETEPMETNQKESKEAMPTPATRTADTNLYPITDRYTKSLTDLITGLWNKKHPDNLMENHKAKNPAELKLQWQLKKERQAIGNEQHPNVADLRNNKELRDKILKAIINGNTSNEGTVEPTKQEINDYYTELFGEE